MNETADVASNLPAIILLSLWWAFLSMLQVFADQGNSASRPSAGRTPDGRNDDDDDENFPELRSADPRFRSSVFLHGACCAYEEVLRAYALCDAEALQALLSAEVFQVFADAFAARSARGETLELTFVGMQSASIESTEVRADSIEITVLFRAQVFQSERTAGAVVRGNPQEIATVADLWTFSRPLPAGVTGWIVVATEQAPAAA